MFYDEINSDSWVWVKINSLPSYADFGIAFDNLGSILIPGKTREEIINLYNGLFGEVAIKEHGTVAIVFKVIDSNPKL